MLNALNHPVFKSNNILVVVAHPDDECLYFFGGLKELAKNARVTVLSATYCCDSHRAKELRSVCLALGVECAFLEIEDLGFWSVLPNLSDCFNNYMARNSFDMIITHPPHGGEKPHPHHLQIFLMSFVFCLKNKFKFGFFSETGTSFCSRAHQKNLFKLKMLPLLFLYSIKTFYHLSWYYKWRWFRSFGKPLLSLPLRHFFQSVLFHRQKIEFANEEKRKVLKMYSSQKSVLESYKSFSSGHEFLFFMTLGGSDFQNVENSTLEYLLESYSGNKSFGSTWLSFSQNFWQQSTERCKWSQ